MKRLFNRIKRKRQDKNLEIFRAEVEMEIKANRFMRGEGLIVGASYKGILLCNNKKYEGELVDVGAVDDGILLTLKLYDNK